MNTNYLFVIELSDHGQTPSEDDQVGDTFETANVEDGDIVPYEITGLTPGYMSIYAFADEDDNGYPGLDEADGWYPADASEIWIDGPLTGIDLTVSK